MKRIVLSFIVLLISLNGFAQCLIGSYTIGGATPDYPTINDAVSDLQLNGVCGPTFFNIRSGIYNEQVEFSGITGGAMVTFQSELDDSSTVIIQYPASNVNTDDYTIHLKGAQFLLFRSISFKRIVTAQEDFASVVLISDTAMINGFDRCYFHTLNKDGTQYLVYNDESSNQDYHTFSNCYFHQGGVGLKLNSLSSTQSSMEVGNSITGCVFNGQTYRGISAYYQDGIEIRNNKIENPSYFNGVITPSEWGSDGHFVGVHIPRCSNSIIEYNDIQLDTDTTTFANYYNPGYTHGAIGVFAFSFSNNTRISNNMILVRNPGLSFGILGGNGETGNDTINVINNSILVDGYNGMQRCTGVILREAYVRFHNNIVNVSMDTAYNDFYTSISSAGQFQEAYQNLESSNNVYSFTIQDQVLSTYEPGGLIHKNLIEVKSMGYELNSIYNIVPFVDELSDLHILYDVDLKNSGKSFSYINLDIDNEARINNPDIGADEFTISNSDDAGISLVNDSSFYWGVCPGQQPLEIVLKNYGVNNLLNSTINYSVDDSIYLPYTWTGNLINLEVDTISVIIDIPIGFDGVIKVWSSQPNGVNDIFNLNDSISFTYHNRLVGEVSTGTGQDFNSFELLDYHMKTYGFCGSIIVNVFDETAEINVDSTYKGIEEIDSVTFISHFNGGTEVDFLNWGSPGFLNLKEKGHYFFSNFNFRNSIYFKCNSIKLDSCYFSAPLVDFKSPYVDITNSELKWANVLIDSSLIINFKNNRQTDGSTEIINSVEFNADSLMLFGKYYLEVRAHKTILKNSRDSIYNLSPSDPSGVLLLDHIYDLSNQPIMLSKSMIIENNDLSHIQVWSDSLTFSNNIGGSFFISSGFADIKNNVGHSRCSFKFISNLLNTRMNVINNTFLIDGLNQEVATIHLINTDSLSQINFSNNIVSVFNSTYSYDPVVRLSAYPQAYGIQGMNNSFYYDSTGSNFLWLENIAQWNSLAQAEALGLFQNSIFHNPILMPDSIHINYDPDLSGTGMYFASVIDDIDGEIRDTSNIDIGADQFSYTENYNIGLILENQPICEGDSIFGNVINYNDSVAIVYFQTQGMINGSQLDVLGHLDSIAPLDTLDHIYLGTFGIDTLGAHNSIYWTLNANGNPDTININDSVQFNSYYYPAIDLGLDTLICSTDSLLISVDSVYANYLWSTNDTTPSIYSPVTGTYSLAVIDSNGCVYKDSIDVIVPILGLSNDTIMCYNETMQLEANGDFQNYLWNTGSTSDSILVDSMAYYSVQAIDVHGCIQLDSILVQEYPFIPPNLPFDTVSCSVQLNISIPSIYSSYLWSSGGTSNSETLNVGIFQDSLYWLSLIDTNNCVYTDSITTRLAQTSVTGDTLFCEGDSSQLSTISGSSYSWSTGEITPTIYATIDGYYSVLIMDGLGCERIGEIEIYSEPLTQIDLVNYNLSTNEFYVEFQNSDYLIWHFGDGDTLLTTTYNNSDTLVDHEYILGGNYSGYVVSFSNCNTDTIYFDIIGVGIEEYNNEISIYPNPTSGLIYLQSKNGNDNYYVTVVDVTGKLLFQENKLPPFIDLTGLSFGVYYIQIIDSKIGGLILHKKIVLVK